MVKVSGQYYYYSIIGEYSWYILSIHLFADHRVLCVGKTCNATSIQILSFLTHFLFLNFFKFFVES